MIKLKEKIGYGLGDMASSMFWKLFGSYLTILLSESLPTALIHGGGSSALICYFLLFRLPSSESLLLLLPNGA